MLLIMKACILACRIQEGVFYLFRFGLSVSLSM